MTLAPVIQPSDPRICGNSRSTEAENWFWTKQHCVVSAMAAASLNAIRIEGGKTAFPYAERLKSIGIRGLFVSFLSLAQQLQVQQLNEVLVPLQLAGAC